MVGSFTVFQRGHSGFELALLISTCQRDDFVVNLPQTRTWLQPMAVVNSFVLCTFCPLKLVSFGVGTGSAAQAQTSSFSAVRAAM